MFPIAQHSPSKRQTLQQQTNCADLRNGRSERTDRTSDFAET